MKRKPLKPNHLPNQERIPAVDCSFDLERQWNLPLIAGIDEVGRGCIAGPVVAASVILPAEQRTHPLEGAWALINDSKKIKPTLRTQLSHFIKENALAFSISFVSERDVDEINILQATFKAARESLKTMIQASGLTPDLILVDGNQTIPGVEIQQQAVVRGDARSKSIAAASLLAKVARDEWMESQEASFPGYGFAQHKGYGTKAHRDALTELGPCKLHRLTFLGESSQAKIQFGRQGEEIAAQYLLSNQMKIVARNWRNRLGEIDIIAESDRGLHFVEVRSRAQFSELAQIFPESKQGQIVKMAESYLLSNQKYQNQALHIDLICIDGDRVEPFWDVLT